MTEMRFETKAPTGLPENKAATFGAEAVLDEFARAFEAFKEANDVRLSEIETRLTADVVTEEKLIRIDALSIRRRTASTGSASTVPGRRSAGRGRRATPPPPSTRRPSTSMSGPARAPASSGWRRRHSPLAPGPTAAISCRRRSSARCCVGSPRSRRFAPSPRCGLSPGGNTSVRFRSTVPLRAGLPRPRLGRRPTRRACPS